MISFAVCIFTLVCMWMIYEKLDIAGWKCLIPIYSLYVLFKRIYNVAAFWVCCAACVVLCIGTGWIACTAVGGVLSAFNLPEVFGGITLANVLIPIILIIAASIVLVVYSIIEYVKLSQAFGMGGAFAVGLIFLTPIFLGILAFDTRMQAIDKGPEGVDAGSDAETDPVSGGSDEVSVQQAEEVRTEESADNGFEKTAVSEPVAAPGNKICPYCKAEIAEGVGKCPFCRSEL